MHRALPPARQEKRPARLAPGRGRKIRAHKGPITRKKSICKFCCVHGLPLYVTLKTQELAVAPPHCVSGIRFDPGFTRPIFWPLLGPFSPEKIAREPPCTFEKGLLRLHAGFSGHQTRGPWEQDSIRRRQFLRFFCYFRPKTIRLTWPEGAVPKLFFVLSPGRTSCGKPPRASGWRGRKGYIDRLINPRLA